VACINLGLQCYGSHIPGTDEGEGKSWFTVCLQHQFCILSSGQWWFIVIHFALFSFLGICSRPTERHALGNNGEDHGFIQQRTWISLRACFIISLITLLALLFSSKYF
jgi:hypothetical protein